MQIRADIAYMQMLRRDCHDSGIERDLDGLGRQYKSVTSDSPSSDIVDTKYDKLGRIASVSNPYRSTSDPTYGTTSYSYDALGRILQVTLPDTNTVTTAYSNRTTNSYSEGTATDKFIQTDDLGRVTSACERTTVTQANGTAPISACNSDFSAYSGFKTAYAYDALNRLTGVNQSGQTRSFSYDALSRLTQEITPEGGQKNYVYDSQNAGDLYTRTAPKENSTSGTVVATYTHDVLHRLTNVSYNDTYTPNARFFWDVQSWLTNPSNNPKGRMARQDTGPCGPGACSGEEYAYDTDGNVIEKSSWAPSNWNTASVTSYYTYNYADLQSTMQDIWGNTYTTLYNSVGRPSQFTSSLVSPPNYPATLYTVDSFNALGQQTTAHFGNAVTRVFTYDHRGRLTGTTDGPTGAPVYTLSVGYTNGNVTSTNDLINGNWSFTYDDFNRLKSSWCNLNCEDGTSAEGFNYGYDQFGNRWTQSLATGSNPGPVRTDSFNSNNQYAVTNCAGTASNYCYDAAGNLLYDGSGGTYHYDAEGRVTAYSSSSNSGSYAYDALGQRVERRVNGTTYDYAFDNNGHENTMGLSGLTGWTWSELYMGNMHVNTYVNGSVYYSDNDHLGTMRTQTDPTGSAAGRYFKNLPFGDWYDHGTQGWLGFTGSLLDDPDGNTFHTPNRQYNPGMGRWMRPDPAGTSAVDVMNPQTWNRYAYVSNSPMSHADPTGLWQNRQEGHYGCNPVANNCPYGSTGGANCMVDGANTPCTMVSMQSGAFGICPDNNCNLLHTGANGQWQIWNPGVKGSDWTSSDGIFHFARMIGGWQTVSDTWHYVDDLLGITGPSKGFRDFCASKGLTAGMESCYGASAVTLQSGNSNRIQQRTADELNKLIEKDLERREWGRALEDLKQFNNLSNDFHGKIMSNGDFVGEVGGGQVNFGNILEFIP